MNLRWILYDPIKETQSEKLTTEEAQFVILRLKTKLINEYLIWREDWPKWKKLNVFLESSDSPFMSIIAPIQEDTKADKGKQEAPTKMSPADGDTVSHVKSSFDFADVKVKEVNINEVFGNKQQFDGDQFASDHSFEHFEPEVKASPGLNFKNLGKSNAGKKNIEDKFKIELLLIHPKGHMFRAVADGISLTGTFCDRIIPGEFHNTIFDCIIINNVISDDDYKRLTLKASIVLTDSKAYIKYEKPTEEQKNILRAGLDYYVRSVKKIAQK